MPPEEGESDEQERDHRCDPREHLRSGHHSHPRRRRVCRDLHAPLTPQAPPEERDPHALPGLLRGPRQRHAGRREDQHRQRYPPAPELLASVRLLRRERQHAGDPDRGAPERRRQRGPQGRREAEGRCGSRRLLHRGGVTRQRRLRRDACPSWYGGRRVSARTRRGQLRQDRRPGRSRRQPDGDLHRRPRRPR